MYKAVGFTDEDLAKPIVGIANTWIETMPCNLNLRTLAEHVKRGVRDAGGTPMEFNTVAISDGVTMGTEGMKASLVSREVIADSIELVGRGHMFDAIVALSHATRRRPARRWRWCASTCLRCCCTAGRSLPDAMPDAISRSSTSYEAIGAHAAGKIDDAESKQIEDHACPGAGAWADSLPPTPWRS